MIFSTVRGSLLFAITTMLVMQASTKSTRTFYMRGRPFNERNVLTLSEILKRGEENILSNPPDSSGDDLKSEDIKTNAPCESNCKSSTNERKVKKDRPKSFNFDNVWDILYAVNMLKDDDRLQLDTMSIEGLRNN